ncbi:hypothetical protein [Allocoleopsis franciscana]|nr:hypothetical protein [Allocoleopsis franciscana]
MIRRRYEHLPLEKGDAPGEQLSKQGRTYKRNIDDLHHITYA